jgi:hypothetical protein
VSDHVNEEQDVQSPTGDAGDAGDSAPEAIGVEDAGPAQPVGPAQLRMRRAPRYRAFGGTGAGIGVLAGVILALSFTATSDYSIRTIVGYFAAIFGLVGAIVGLAAAVLIERRRT